MKYFSIISRGVLSLLLALSASLPGRSQTPLVAGDLVFTSYNSNAGCPNDSFSFVLLKNITNGTSINFTDRSYTAGGFAAASGTEGSINWTSSGTLAAGTEVLIAGLSARVNGVVNGTVVLLDGTCGAGLSLSTGGDQIFAFQGALAPANIISGLHFGNCPSFTTDAAWDNSGCGTGQSFSNLPPGLTAGFSSLWMGLAPGGLIAVQAAFNCSGVSSPDIAVIRSLVYDKNNWTKLNTATGELPTPSACAFIVPLDLSWLQLEARFVGEAVQLQWKTTGQENAIAYVVERSEDGRIFQSIEKIAAVKGSSEATYQSLDAQHLAAPTRWYRIKALEASGKVGYSAVTSVRTTSLASRAEFSISQNIANGSAVLTIAAPREGSAEISITDAAGRVLSRDKQHVAAGHQTHELPRILREGQLYLVNVRFNGEVWTGKITGW